MSTAQVTSSSCLTWQQGAAAASVVVGGIGIALGIIALLGNHHFLRMNGFFDSLDLTGRWVIVGVGASFFLSGLTAIVYNRLNKKPQETPPRSLPRLEL